MSSFQSPQPQSLPPRYFEEMYSENPDPWQFETSEYEAKKYAATVAALPKPIYRSAFEIGGSIGVLTQKLADRCENLLSVDVSQVAQAKAIERCQNLSQVRFEIMQVPQQFPDEQFDLILVSEVGYYLSKQDLQTTQSHILNHLEIGGHLLLVHWTLYARDYPLSGDEVHDSFLALSAEQLTSRSLRHLAGQREEQYRLDLFERVS
ncbi:MAG: nodulation S family protein [Drouetiella hepatica Uher 2000/2452]|jgi:predicted TPR repeat methyltransferase|uniref:Nodulation S family protein n=1 Tax=Drouetiella hepatica Uher 2000/2452 TaxID=904376 RepID=A0A951QHZ6_9CYAN|nr:nodulation S family protein [Drouetiella hepatica Uher 2000/2452]